jgi:DNA-binding NarL/FixJ family response regulator
LTGLSRLTTRELEIVNRLVSGDRVPSIAKALFLSPSTVRNHLHSIYRKLAIHSQQELIHAFRRGSTLR